MCICGQRTGLPPGAEAAAGDIPASMIPSLRVNGVPAGSQGYDYAASSEEATAGPRKTLYLFWKTV